MQLLLTASECAAFSAASFPKTGIAAENDRTKTSAITDHFFTSLTPFAIMTKNFIVQEAFRASQATLCIMPKSLRNILGRLNEDLAVVKLNLASWISTEMVTLPSNNRELKNFRIRVRITFLG
ncbi:MAG: hypothetical protein OXG49_05400 [Chloroflexi bacterium]|nr:hypothetical protein [Chloroflexota bacterium]